MLPPAGKRGSEPGVRGDGATRREALSGGGGLKRPAAGNAAAGDAAATDAASAGPSLPYSEAALFRQWRACWQEGRRTGRPPAHSHTPAHW